MLVDKDGNELTLKWDKEFGRPDTTAYLLLQALFHKSTREGHPFTDTVTFHQEELWKLMGREQTGGRQNKDVANAIAQLPAAILDEVRPAERAVPKSTLIELVRIPAIATARTDPSQPLVPMDCDRCGAGVLEGTFGCVG